MKVDNVFERSRNTCLPEPSKRTENEDLHQEGGFSPTCEVLLLAGVPPYTHLAVFTLSSLVEQTTPMKLGFASRSAQHSDLLSRKPQASGSILTAILYHTTTIL